ncbi:hypothetical protein AAG906_000338 [Vitis piasezkii]
MEALAPRNKKELQRLTGKLVTLGRFIALFTDKLRPFFLVLQKASAIGWTDNCQSAFENIKHYLTQLPILSSPQPGERLYMYLAVSDWAISVVLFHYPTHKEHKLVYYVIRAMSDLETRYSRIKQTALALRTLPVVILTDQPIRNILHKPNMSERMLQWAIELSEYGIEYRPRLSMKGQVTTNFVQAIQLGFPTLNNEVEYEAILSGLDLALALFVSKLQIYNDSQLVVRHVQEKYEAKDERMTRYLTKVRDTLQRLDEWTIKKIPRADNVCADALARIVVSLPIKEAILLPIYVQTSPFITKASTCNTIEEMQAARFALIGECLYKRSFIGPYLRCLDHLEAQYVLAELHEGVCDNHFGG